jgi:hypothetical protein
MEQSQVQATGDKKLRVGGHLRTLTAVFAIAALTGGGFAVAAGATVFEVRPPHATQDFSTHRITQYPGLSGSGRMSTERIGGVAGPIAASAPANVAQTSGDLSDDGRVLHDLTPGSALHCLGMNVYWEARNQEIAGQLAVAQVTLNRVRDSRYPNDICNVVYDHKQFSWYWDGKSDTPKDKQAWDTALMVASAAMDGTGHAELQGVTHYHAVYIQPYWKDYMTMVAMIGDHIFYVD